MIEIKLRLRHTSDGRLILELGYGFRIMFAVLAVVFAAATLTGEQVSALAVVIIAILVLGALYQERWEFDSATQTLHARHGLIVVHRHRTYQVAAIATVEYADYYAGTVPGAAVPQDETDARAPSAGTLRSMLSPQSRRYLRYGLRMQDDSWIRIETRRVRDWTDDLALPKALADAMGVVLERNEL